MSRTPRQTVLAWVEAFNATDIDTLMNCYADDAINHQIAYGPLEGKAAIRGLFDLEFGRAKMVCQIENLFEDGDWAILEWSDPLGVRGCGFFHVRDGLIVHQRGYFDRLSFFEAQGLPLEEALKA